jgi:hypothetical protein
MTREELRIKLSELIQKRHPKPVYLVGGALGELQGCNAYEEETIREGMWRTKYFGVSYWFKGITDNDIIDRVTITKRAFKEIISLIPFRIGKVIRGFHEIYTCEGGLKSKCLKQDEFCLVCRELIRTGMKLTKDDVIKDLIFCFAMFLQFSPTYRVWLQDILGELDKEKFLRQPLTEVLRLKRIFINRVQGCENARKLIWRVIFLAVLFKRNWAKKFIKELDLDKTKLDKEDMYFCLRRNSYNFGGKELWDRVKEAAIIDDEEGNLVLGI